MKRIAIVVAALGVVAGLIACGGEPKPPTMPENPAGSAAVPETPSATPPATPEPPKAP